MFPHILKVELTTPFSWRVGISSAILPKMKSKGKNRTQVSDYPNPRYLLLRHGCLQWLRRWQLVNGQHWKLGWTWFGLHYAFCSLQKLLTRKKLRLFHLCLHSGSSKPMISYSPNVSSKCFFALVYIILWFGVEVADRTWRRGKWSTFLGEEEQRQLSLQHPGGVIIQNPRYVCHHLKIRAELLWFELIKSSESSAEGLWLSHFWRRVSGVSFLFDIGAQRLERINTLRI